MTSVHITGWEEVNQQYLAAAIMAVREELEKYKASAERQDAAGRSNPEEGAPSPQTLFNTAEMISSPPAIETLTDIFNLTSFERKIVLMCAGVELDSSFANLVTSIQSRTGLLLPTFSLALAAFRDAHWSALSPAAPLRKFALVETDSGQLLTRSQLKIDERVLHYLTGVFYMDERLNGFTEPFSTETHLAQSHREKAEHIAGLLKRSQAENILPVVVIHGPDKGDNMAIAASVSARLGMHLLTTRTFVLPAQARDTEELLKIWNKESALGNAALYLDCSAAATGDHFQLQATIRFCEKASGLLFAGSCPWELSLQRNTISIEVQKPTLKEQQQLWKRSIPLDGELDIVASQFNLSAAGIKEIISEQIREHEMSEETAAVDSGRMISQLWKRCCRHSRQKLETLAQRIEPLAQWEDLILPTPQINLLKEIAMHVKQRVKVYEEWGFKSRSSRGLGISALFTGESGTGKTMAAEVLANEMNLDLYRIDLSQVVNKYIGETEKNLKKIFDAAEDGGAILLFDEADALFGKRSEVKDSHDRYANIEVSYLLQRMEEYQGLAILTTNMKSALDKAFLRRIRFLVQFPFPGTTEKIDIWKRVFPAETPTKDLDWNKLARMNLAGGSIRNIALGAAFIAADKGEPVGMEHIARAARSEYAKLEKSMSMGEIIV